MATTIPGLASTIEVVDKSGKVLSSGKSVFQAFKDAKAAYHARKAEILAERAMQRAAKEGAKLAAIEKEARRAERHRKRLEYQRKTEEREAKKEGDRKAIESDTKDKDKEKKKKDKKDKSSGKELVVYGESKEKREKEKKEKKEKKHRTHSSSNRGRKGSTSSSSSSSESSSKEEEPSAAIDIVSPPTPPAEEDICGPSGLHLPYNASLISLAQTLHNAPAGGPAAQLLGITPQVLALIDPDGDSPLSALLIQLTNILDTLDCLNASMATLIAALQKDPDAVAVVGFTLAQISAIVAKTAPSVVLAAKAAFPVIFALLASPQFIVTAGASVIILGGYKIIRSFTGGSGNAVAPATTEEPKNDEHAKDEDDHLAYGPGMEDAHAHEEQEMQTKRLEGPRRALTLPAPSSSVTSTVISDAVSAAQQAPPTPPKTPPIEEDEKEKDPKKGKRNVLKRFLTTKN